MLRDNPMSEKSLLFILKAGLSLSLFIVLFVFKNLLFPYITSKQIPFNILMEVLFVFWLVLIVKYPRFQPSFSYITGGLIAFFTAITVSAIAGVDFNLSFWGDVERMLGVFHLLHFFVFYLILITVMRSWTDWKVFFIISLGVGVIISMIGLSQNTPAPYSQIGNTAYVSAYIIFNLYFSLILFFKENVKSLRWLYLLPWLLFIPHFYRLNTSGAIVGLGFSVLVVFFLYSLLMSRGRMKTIILSLTAVLTVASILLLINKDSQFVRGNQVLRIVGEINLKKPTFMTRVLSWKAAFQDFHNHPFLGTGFGNYAITFDKYFDPTFYNYTRAETYFDRAHNNVVDIASTNGAIGITAYLSIFGALGYYLIRGYRKRYFDLHQFVLISGLSTAYFVQNLAVFDSFVTYVGLMMMLALVYWIYRQGDDGAADRATARVKDSFLSAEAQKNSEIYVFVIAGFIVLTIMYQFNIKPWKMLIGTIDGQIAWSAGKPVEAYEIYRKTLNADTVLDRDSRSSFNRLINAGAAMNGIEAGKRQEIIDYNIELAEKNVAYNREDSLSQMALSEAYAVAASYNAGNSVKFDYYIKSALAAIDKSIAASPGRVPTYYSKAQIYLTAGDKDKALETLKYAYGLNPVYYDSACYIAKTLEMFGRDPKDQDRYYGECVKLHGTNLLGAAKAEALVEKYRKEKRDDLVLNIYVDLANANPKVVKYWIELAKAYEKMGDNDKAVTAAKKAITADPTVKDYAEKYILQLEK